MGLRFAMTAKMLPHIVYSACESACSALRMLHTSSRCKQFLPRASHLSNGRGVSTKSCMALQHLIYESEPLVPEASHYRQPLHLVAGQQWRAPPYPELCHGQTWLHSAAHHQHREEHSKRGTRNATISQLRVRGASSTVGSDMKSSGKTRLPIISWSEFICFRPVVAGCKSHGGSHA